jgi:hypothetical protein
MEENQNDEPVNAEEPSGLDENQSLLDALSELPAEPTPSQLPEIGDSPSDGAAEELAAALESMDAIDEGVASEGFAPLPGTEGLPDAESLADPLPDDLGDTPLNPDPALDVEQMLAAEIPLDPQADAMPAMDAGSAPTFQLQIDAKPEQREALKALAQSLSIELPEGSSPLLSQLTEYQALAFRQAALALGANAKASIHFPLPSLTEEDQALGDLAMVKETQLPLTEGAPSVALPKHERDVMVLTEVGANIQVLQTFGLVTAHRSIARRFFREEEAQEKLRKELQRLPARGANIPASRLEALLRELILDLQKMALQRGGNALFGLRLESFSETSHLDPELEQMRLVAFGTAAIVEKALQA